MQTAELIPAPSDKESEIVTTASELLAMANRAVIDTPEKMNKGATLCKLIRNAQKEIETERTKITKPLNDVLKHVNERFRLYKGPLDEAQAIIDQKMIVFSRAEDKRLREEAEAKRKADEEAAREAAKKLAAQNKPAEAAAVVAQVIDTPTPAPQKLGPARGEFGGTASVKENWQFEIVDLTKVPREYLCIDEIKVRAHIKTGTREIAGLKIYDKGTLSVR